MPRSPRKNQWLRAVAKCDGHCWYCGETPENLTVDHAKPRSRGGLNRDDNLLPACSRCNCLKDNMTVAEFRKYVRVLVIRNLAALGYWIGLENVKIVFFGEGNSSPLRW